jgi:hypothetical protein
MPKKAKELSALEVQRIKMPGLHAVGVVAGLHLQVLPSGARSWVLRVVIGGKRRDMGLGGYPDVTLAGAREKARAARETIEQGIDPIAVRVAAKSALAAHAVLPLPSRMRPNASSMPNPANGRTQSTASNGAIP